MSTAQQLATFDAIELLARKRLACFAGCSFDGWQRLFNAGYRLTQELDASLQVRKDFGRIRRTRSCYRCGASPEHCECSDQMEPDNAR